MSDDESPRGRLYLVTGARAAGTTSVGHALARRFERAVAIDGDVFDQMVVSGRDPFDEPPSPEQVRQLFLRWSAAIATAETYQLEGFDAVISDTVLGGHLEDFLDLASPETVHVIVLHDTLDRRTPRWGLWIDRCEQTIEETVTEILARLDEAVVVTDPSA